MLYIRAWVYKVNSCLKDEYLKIFRVLNNDGKVLQMRLKKNDIFLGKSLEVLIKSDIDQRFDPSIYFIRNLTWACASALKGKKGVSLYISPTTLYFSCYSELFRDFESHSNSAFENTTLSEINTIFIYTCDDIVSCFTVMFLITAIIDDIDNLHHNELVSFQWVIKISSNSTKHLFERKPFNSCYRIWDIVNYVKTVKL